MLGARTFRTGESLIRFHEAVLFLRAYPPDRATRDFAERLLARFGERVAALARSGANLAARDEPEVAGIAGTQIETDYSFDVVRWLARRFPARIRLDWGSDGREDRLRALLPRFLPLLDEEALEDANVAYLEWLRAAQPDPARDLRWVIERLERLPLSEADRAERYEALKLPIVWSLGTGRGTRTRLRWLSAHAFFHRDPLLARRDVSLPEELASRRLPVRRLTRREGRKLLDFARESTAVRYREYYQFTYGDPASVRAAKIGRGVEIFLVGLETGRRLPLRSGYAGLVIKNGVPVCYFEALAFIERIEVGFNVYYTFREGESAWIFARILRMLHQILGVTSFSIDPYQLGHENPEGIDSGAFWFYRKLGFRPTGTGSARLLAHEERKIAGTPGYRSSPRTLRRLVTGSLLYEMRPSRDWDRFHVRNIGLAVQRRMRARYRGDADEARRRAASRVARLLEIRIPAGPGFESLALVLDAVPDLPLWTRAERAAVVPIVRAKEGAEEIRYLRLLQAHAKLRKALIRLGSRPLSS
ncbi:MAG: hypothetical protein ABJC28_04085 [Acidobacteriota bacterium]